ncbi:MAG TPA: MarR family transcriptional regulator [Nakamurella sp.]|nr:MarR family transcriptional regulator [Nakamurella sp.]
MTDGGPQWLSQAQQQAWLGLIAVVELLPGALDGQLQRDAGISHFEYMAMSMLSEAPDHTLRMTTLASRTNSTLPRLSHVITRLVAKGYVERVPCPEDKRATNAHLTDAGWEHVQAAAPGHVATVDALIIEPLSPAQIQQLREITAAILSRLDPEEHFSSGS